MKKLLVAVGIISLISVKAYADDIVAKIGDRKITGQDYINFIESFPPDKKKFLDDNLQNRKMVLERMVQVEVVSEIARKKGLDKDPKISIQLDNILKEFLAQEMLKTVGEGEPTAEDITQYYRAHPEEFRMPEMVRARHILVKIGKAAPGIDMIMERSKAKEKADALLARIKAGEDFAKLAEENSDDTASKPKGGDLGFLPRGKKPAEFEAKVFSMKVGEMSEVVEANYGFHIIKVEARKDAGVEPLDDIREKVKEKVKAFVKQSKTSEFMHQAFKDAGVVFYMDNVKLPERKK
ncbi:MAG: peptidylprolyl isomerase [Thermodesulfovibrionales bacterium]